MLFEDLFLKSESVPGCCREMIDWHQSSRGLHYVCFWSELGSELRAEFGLNFGLKVQAGFLNKASIYRVVRGLNGPSLVICRLDWISTRQTQFPSFIGFRPFKRYEFGLTLGPEFWSEFGLSYLVQHWCSLPRMVPSRKKTECFKFLQ